MEHRFRWLWNFVFIPATIIILGFGFHNQNKAKEKLEDTNEKISVLTKSVESLNDDVKSLSGKASADVILNNYADVNSAMQNATKRIVDWQHQMFDAYTMDTYEERDAKLLELKPIRDELFKNGYNGPQVFIFDKTWKLVPSTSTPFSQNVIPVVFKMEDANGTLVGAAFMKYYVSADSFELVNVGYIGDVERLAL